MNSAKVSDSASPKSLSTDTLIPVPAETNKKLKEKIRALEKDINNHKTEMGNSPSIESGIRPDPI